MPHPRRLPTPKIPRFSSIVKPDEAPALQSPHAHENAPLNGLPAPTQQPFNPKVAAYTFGFVSVLIGGLYIGAQSKEFMQNWEVCTLNFRTYKSNESNIKVYRRKGKLPSKIPCCIVNCSLRKFGKTLQQQRERLEDQIAVIRIQAEDEARKRRP